MKEQLASSPIIPKKLFYVASIIGGPIATGSIVAYNWWQLGEKVKAWFALFLAFILNLLHNALIFLWLIPLIRPSGMHRMGPDFLLSLGIYLGVQVLLCLLISQLLRIKDWRTCIFPVEQLYFTKWQLVPILLISLLFLLISIDKPMLFSPFPNVMVLLYIIPHLVFYSKVKNIFKSLHWLKLSRWIILLAASYMPLVFVLNDILPAQIMGLPMLVAGFYLYALLYLVLLAACWLILKKVLCKFKLLPLRVIKHHRVRVGALVGMLLGVAVILIFGNVRFNNINVNSYSIQIDAKESKLDKLKIVLVADMHLNNYTNKAFVKSFVNRVQEINPDLIIYAGDMLEGSQLNGSALEEFSQDLSELNPKHGTYAVGGNHDSFNYNGYNEKVNIYFVRDTVYNISDAYYIMGMAYRSFQKRPFDKMKTMMTENLPVIVVDHNPSQIARAAENGIDMHLSGHTHNGQVWPFNYLINAMYELPWGYSKIKDAHFFVTSGIQGWGAPIRTTGQSEIMLINVEFVE